MNDYPEIPSNNIRRIKNKLYFVKKFGMNGIVYEEKLIPIPDINEKIKVKVYKEDGTLDYEKEKIRPKSINIDLPLD